MRRFEMGFFRREAEPEPTPVTTDMDIDWFTRWAADIRERKGSVELQLALDAEDETDAFAALWDRASAVIDHDCRDYVQRYLDGRALRRYAAFYPSDNATPWDLISLVCGLNPADETGWTRFVVDDMKATLERFADIMVDPSIVE
jgi:hypothetical protein